MDMQSGDIVVTDSRAQPVPEAVAITQISPELLREELDIFKQQLLEIHPQPFARTSRAEFEKAFKQVKDSLMYPLSRAEFFLRLAPLVASLRDVHSYLNLPKDQFGDLSIRNEKLFPLAVIVHQQKFYVAADLSDEPQIPIGAEITQINNAPSDYLLNVMRSLTARETNSGQFRRIQLDFTWLLAAMGYARQSYEVEYSWQGKSYLAQLDGLEIANTSKDSKPAISYYGYSRLTPNTALLWLNDFNENPEVFSAYLEKQFTQMADYQIDNLIIDVRYNQGGLSENLKNLLAHLTDEPVYWASQGVIKISDELKNNHINKTKARRESKYKWGLQWLPLEWTDKLQHSIYWADLGETITLTLESITPIDSYRPKRVWVLTNGFCYSACSLFVASVNHYQLAKTMGEQTGSLARYQFAYPVKVQLPHSGMSINLPTMRLDFPFGDAEQLIQPQETVLRSLQDIQERRDPVLNRALKQAEISSTRKVSTNSE